MRRRTVGLTLSLLGFMWLISVVQSHWQWHQEIAPFHEVAQSGDLTALKGWIRDHPTTCERWQYRQAALEVCLDACPRIGNGLTTEAVDRTFLVLTDSIRDLDDESCERAFVAAVDYGLYRTIKRLIERGIDVNCRDAGGWTALVRAAEHGDADLVRMLLSKGADPNTEFDYHVGALGGRYSVLRYVRYRMARSPGEEPAPNWRIEVAERYEPVIQLLKQYGARD